MKKQIPAICLAVIVLILAFALYSAKQENVQFKQDIAELKAQPDAPVVTKADAKTETPASAKEVAIATTPEPAVQAGEETVASEEKENAGERLMSSFSKMMDNPTMNKVMEASQRGAVGALYADLIEYLNLNAEETKYFMDLLMHRQMKQTDVAMKMMGGNLSDEEKGPLQNELKEIDKLVRSEMKKFLNNEEDFKEYKFYEKTIGERMMLSQMDQSLSGTEAALSDESYRSLLGMMHDERSNFSFSSDLHDNENTDISAERFSKQNLDNFATDMDALNAQIIQRAQSMLTAEQLAAFEAALKATADMQKAQIEMAGQMFSKKQN